MKSKFSKTVKAIFTSSLIVVMAMYSCKNNDNSVDIKPTGPVPSWGPSIKPEMQAVIEKLVSLGGKPIETLEPTEARVQPTPTDAVKAIMKDYNIPVPTAQCDTTGKEIAVTGGTTHLRIYTPKTGAASYPVIMYYHGGGFVIADINVYNSSAQGLCEQVGAVVVAVEYPKAPENKFPAAHIASFDAYQWVLKNASSIKADSNKIAVAGESAGGNLAINMSIMARDKGIKMPLYQVLVYPVADNNMNSESYLKYADAKPLNKAMMAWFVKYALASPEQATDPRIAVVNANLAGLPKTLIIGAEIDPLQSEGKLLSDRLKAANVDTEYEIYNGVTHEFYGMATVVPQAKEAQTLAAKKLKAAFGL